MTSPLPDPARCYWSEQMEAAFAFMEAMSRYPIQESGEAFASLREAMEGVEVQFSTSRINGTFPRVYFLRRSLVESLRNVAEAMNRRGWVLKIEDAYRSPAMQRGQSHNPLHFDAILEKVRWELGGALPDAALMMRRVSAMIATRCRVGTHLSGSAIDLSVFDRATGEEIDRGGSYIEFSERTPMASPFVTPEQRRNRDAIEALMLEYGWHAYPFEFWHYSSGDCYAESLAGSGQPGRFGPVRFDEANPLAPLDCISEEESQQWLEPVSFFEAQIKAALQRSEGKG